MFCLFAPRPALFLPAPVLRPPTPACPSLAAMNVLLVEVVGKFLMENAAAGQPNVEGAVDTIVVHRLMCKWMTVCRHESLQMERFLLMKAARSFFEQTAQEHKEDYEAACAT